MEFSNWLQNKLGERALKKSQLSMYSGISDAEISRLISGKRKPSAKTLNKLAPALKVSQFEIFQRAGYLPDDESVEMKILRGLTEEVIEALDNPIAKKALLFTHYTKKDTEPLVAEILETIANMDPEKLKAIIKLCQV